jgi:hypothetical protein
MKKTVCAAEYPSSAGLLSPIPETETRKLLMITDVDRRGRMIAVSTIATVATQSRMIGAIIRRMCIVLRVMETTTMASSPQME